MFSYLLWQRVVPVYALNKTTRAVFILPGEVTYYLAALIRSVQLQMHVHHGGTHTQTAVCFCLFVYLLTLHVQARFGVKYDNQGRA